MEASREQGDSRHVSRNHPPRGGEQRYGSAKTRREPRPPLRASASPENEILTTQTRWTNRDQLPRIGSISPGFMLRSRHQRSITSALKRQSVPMRKPGNSPRRRSL